MAAIKPSYKLVIYVADRNFHEKSSHEDNPSYGNFQGYDQSAVHVIL